MLLSCEKRDKLQKASKACFASTLQRAWTLWGAHVHRQKLLRKALESRQVSMSCLPLCILHNNHKTQFVAGSQSLVISKACLLRLYSMVGLFCQNHYHIHSKSKEIAFAGSCSVSGLV